MQFRAHEIVAWGQNERLIRFLPEERGSFNCRYATEEQIREHFPGYQLDPLEYLTYDFIIEKDGKVLED